MGQIRTAYLLCTRITLETTTLRVIWKRSSRMSSICTDVQVCVSECFRNYRVVFRIYGKSRFCTNLRPKNHPWSKSFDHTVLCSYFMKHYDILTKWILKTYSMWEKYVQIMYRSINNAKIDLKCTTPPNSMGRIRTAYLLYTRITLETTALWFIWKRSSRRTGVFHGSRCVFSNVSQVPRGFFKFVKNRDFSPCMGQKKIVHELTPLITPYSAHILWKLMIFWQNESSGRILCRKNVYRSCTAQ